MSEAIVPTFDKIVDQITRLKSLDAIQANTTVKICILTKDNAPSNGLYQVGTFEEWIAKYYSGFDADTMARWAAAIRSNYDDAKNINASVGDRYFSDPEATIIKEQVLKLWGDATNVTFSYVDDPASADIRIGINAVQAPETLPNNVPISINFMPGRGGIGYVGPEKPNDVFLEGSAALRGMDARNINTLAHEFGHAFGLSHQALGNGDGNLASQYDSLQWALMSYKTGFSSRFQALTPMLMDTVGLKSLGLLKSEMNSGSGDIYTFNKPEQGKVIIDTGGDNDTLSAANQTVDCEIDLRATDFAAGKAYFSSIGMSSVTEYNVAIFEGTTIENATGGSGKDKLIGNDVANVLDGGAGDDTLQAGAGSDTYKFSGSFGKDTLDESTAKGGDNSGSININGTTITATGDMVGKYDLSKGARPNTYRAKINGQDYTYTLKTGDTTNGDQLVIAKKGDSANTITLNHIDRDALFSSTGYLGIKLDPTRKVALIQGDGASVGASTSNVWGDLNFDAASLSGKLSSLIEGGGKAFTLYLNQAAKAGDTIKLALSDLGDKFQVILGDSTVAANGAVITLTEGQTEARFALVESGDITADASLQISASYTSGDTSTTSNSWGVNLKDAGNAEQNLNGDFAALTGTYSGRTLTRFDDQGHETIVLSRGDLAYGHDNLSNLVAGTGAVVNDNVIFGSTANDQLNGLTGNDALSGREGSDQIDGGAGDDFIGGGAGSDNILGGDGNDYISSAADISQVTMQLSPNDTWSRWGQTTGLQVLASGATWAVYNRELNFAIEVVACCAFLMSARGQFDLKTQAANNPIWRVKA